MTSVAGSTRCIAKVSGLVAGAMFASPVLAANGIGSIWPALEQTDPATLLLCGSLGLLALAIALKVAMWVEGRRNYRPQFFPTDRQIPIEPAPHS
jgi:hypothetical protein